MVAALAKAPHGDKSVAVRGLHTCLEGPRITLAAGSGGPPGARQSSDPLTGQCVVSLLGGRSLAALAITGLQI